MNPSKLPTGQIVLQYNLPLDAASQKITIKKVKGNKIEIAFTFL